MAWPTPLPEESPEERPPPLCPPGPPWPPPVPLGRARARIVASNPESITTATLIRFFMTKIPIVHQTTPHRQVFPIRLNFEPCRCFHGTASRKLNCCGSSEMARIAATRVAGMVLRSESHAACAASRRSATLETASLEWPEPPVKFQAGLLPAGRLSTIVKFHATLSGF